MTAADAVDVMTDPSSGERATRYNKGHVPVMATAAISALAPERGGLFVDATYGRGGHAHALLDSLPADARVIALDQDPDAAAVAAQHVQDDPRLVFEPANFADLDAVLGRLGLGCGVNGVLFDLGVSSPQLTSAERGFSLRYPGPLDMRMNPGVGQPLAEWLARVDIATLARVIRRYGDESQADRIARAIIAARNAGRLRDSGDLANVVAEAVPARVARGRSTHPATKTFNALRVQINDELGALKTGLDAAIRALLPGGRLVVISFQSQEDRLVKRALRDQAKPRQAPLPMADEVPPSLELLGKPIKPDDTEIAANSRARSAIMRIARRTEYPVITP